MTLYNSNLPHMHNIVRRRGNACIVLRVGENQNIEAIEAVYTTMDKANTHIERARSKDRTLQFRVEKMGLI